MNDNKKQLLDNINGLLDNMAKAEKLTASISQLEAENTKLQHELDVCPTKQTTYADEAREEIKEEAEYIDRKLDKKLNKVFIVLAAILTVINAVLLFAFVNKEAVAEKMQKLNMTFAGNYTMDEIIGVLFPFTLILALIFQAIATFTFVFIAKSVDIGDR